jgi:signal peptidase I
MAAIQRLKQAKEFLVETLKVVLVALAIIIPVRHFLIQPFYVKGASMEPNFQDHEYLIIDEITYRFREPQRGEIVVFVSPSGNGQYFIKRLIGMPHDTIAIQDGKVVVNSTTLDESAYLAKGVTTQPDVAPKTLGANEYFVLGDNRAFSFDSRYFGPLAKTSIIGRAALRGWPYSRIQWFEAPSY